MEKGWEQVVGALGVLKAGAAYLPVDPALPRERLWYLLENGEVAVALTQSGVEERLQWPDRVRRVCVDAEQLLGLPDSPLETLQRAEDLACVIYTSGSTGAPKGVMLAHEGLVNSITYANQRCAVGPRDRVLSLTALHHDMSIYDTFGILAAGGAIVMPTPELRRDPGHWLELMRRAEVSVWNTVPAMMEMLVDYVAGQEQAVPASLRLVFLGGDWIPVTLPDRLRGLVEGVEVFSVGGPTETSLWNIWYEIEAVEPTWKSIPYGRPIANTRYYVLGESLQECPVWVAGELYCGGVGLSKGYWRDEAKTLAAFITHPRTGERLYRTGDLGRHLPDGNIEFLGREDFQVKIRGQRIELGEIDATLRQHPRVRAAAAVVVGEEASRRLVVHVVRQESAACDLDGIAGLPGGDGTLDFAAGQGDDAIADPVARIDFKLKQHGLRRDDDRVQIQLVAPEADEMLEPRYVLRRSDRIFLPGPIPFARFGHLLSCLHQIEIDGLPKYRYPSGGGLYPVQVYLFVKADRVEGVAQGTYYYHPKRHALMLLCGEASVGADVHFPPNQPIFADSAFSIFLIAQMKAIVPLYGPVARDFALLEAGYLGQLLMSEAAASEIGICPIGMLNFAGIRKQFALEEGHEFLHSFLAGPIDATKRDGWSLRPQAPGLASGSPAGRVDTDPDGLVRELRLFLKDRLPAHMVPSAFVFRDALPLTSNGKVDRKALASSATGSFLETRAPYAPPKSDVEKSIAVVLEELLNREKLGVEDNFFDLGADSLTVVKAYNRLRGELQREFPLVALFRHPTISLLAAYLNQEGDERGSLSASQERGEARRELTRRRRELRESRRPADSQPRGPA